MYFWRSGGKEEGHTVGGDLHQVICSHKLHIPLINTFPSLFSAFLQQVREDVHDGVVVAVVHVEETEEGFVACRKVRGHLLHVLKRQEFSSITNPYTKVPKP